MISKCPRLHPKCRVRKVWYMLIIFWRMCRLPNHVPVYHTVVKPLPYKLLRILGSCPNSIQTSSIDPTIYKTKRKIKDFSNILGFEAFSTAKILNYWPEYEIQMKTKRVCNLFSKYTTIHMSHSINQNTQTVNNTYCKQIHLAIMQFLDKFSLEYCYQHTCMS